MDRERAERHLRLVAEAALRHARTLPSGIGGEVHPYDVFTSCVRRFQWAAAALIAVGAVDTGRADVLLDELQAALAVRHLSAINSGPAFRRQAGALGPAAGPTGPAGLTGPLAGRPVGSPAGLPEATSACGAPRLIPIGRMLPFRNEAGSGELYLMSLVVTGTQAVIPAVAGYRPSGRGARVFPSPSPLPPFEGVSATDDRGTSYQVYSHGALMRPDWSGHLEIRPVPPAGARWLEVSGAAHASARIDLTRPAGSCAAPVEPRTAPAAEKLLENVAQHILAVAAELPGVAKQTADGAADMVAALEAAGTLSPFSAVPGYLATVCERLGIDDHRIPARPAARLPEPWLSVLACYGRRHRPEVRDGTAAVAVLLPELDGARIALTGLHTMRGHSFLHVFGRGLAQALPARCGPAAHPAFGWWLRDDAGHWHVAVQRHGEQGFGDGEIMLELRVVPPLSHETACCTLLVTTRTAQAGVQLPLAWWASP
ncbi:MAG: hypothetical protein ACLPKE_14110 [Streptosporangiaceae bacterium]